MSKKEQRVSIVMPSSSTPVLSTREGPPQVPETTKDAEPLEVLRQWCLPVVKLRALKNCFEPEDDGDFDKRSVSSVMQRATESRLLLGKGLR